jgi:signal transduction histidine kinase
VLIVTAAGLLIPLAVGRWTATATSRLVVELGSGTGEGPLTTRLAQALRDPRLELRLRLPDGEWVNESGVRVAAPAPDSPDRIGTRRVTGDGTEIVLLHDPSALPDRAVAESAVVVAGTAVDNARRDREVRARIADLRDLRRRLLDAADQERRQLELELRSGALHELAEIDALLSQLPSGRVDTARRELATAGTELVDLANGLHPAELLRAGLGSALAGVAQGLAIPVELQITDRAELIPPAVTISAYYLAVEALANVTKHAGASRARLELTITQHELRLRVSDDGNGGADPEGRGLRGLRDRASAVDGHLRVYSPQGAGTLLEARLPLTLGAQSRLTSQ